MKKTILGLICVFVLLTSVNIASAKVKATSPATAQAIKYYKSGNYVQSYVSCMDIVKKDPSNALAQYYLAMSNVQLGKKQEAISAYDTVIALSPNGVLGSYAQRGKRCIETPSLCHEPQVKDADETLEDKFIKYGSGFSKKARGVHEREKIENIKREINRYDDLSPSKFKDYKDYSSQAPSNDDIVAAIRTLQRAGLADISTENGYSDIQALLGINGSNRDYEMLNMLYGNNNGSKKLSPQVIQSLLTTQMTTNF